MNYNHQRDSMVIPLTWYFFDSYLKNLVSHYSEASGFEKKRLLVDLLDTLEHSAEMHSVEELLTHKNESIRNFAKKWLLPSVRERFENELKELKEGTS